MKEGQEWLIAICTHRGIYQFCVMLFGLKNAPATFQHLIESVLGILCLTCAVAYVNNILIHSPDKATHAQDLEKVVTTIHKAGLFIKPSKCKLFKTKVTFLGNVVLSEGHVVSPKKREAILLWPTPVAQDKLCSSLGTVTYLKKFSLAISQLVAPLYELAGNSTKFLWTDEQQWAINILKETFVSTPVLRYANLDKLYIITCESSSIAIGAVLLQEHDGLKHPVAYYSWKLTHSEQNWAIYDKELQAAVVSLRHWCHLVQGGRYCITVRTDHKALQHYKKP